MLEPVKIQITADTTKLKKSLKEAETNLKKLDPAAAKAATSLNKVEKETKDVAVGFDKAKTSSKGFFTALVASQAVITVVSGLFRRLTRSFTDSIKASLELESSLIEIRKVTGATGPEINNLKNFIQDLAVETGIATTEIGDIAAAGGRLGIFAREGSAGLETFTRTIAQSRIAMTDFAGSAEEASDKTSVLLNLFNLESRDAEVLLSILNELSNTAAATSGAIADNVTSIASLSSTFGIANTDLLAIATTMEEVGAESQAFSSAFQTAIQEMQKDTQKFADFIGPELGPKFTKAFAEDPIKAFQLFLEGLNDAGRDAGQVLEQLGIGDRRITRELSKIATDKGLERLAINLETASDAAEQATDAVNGVAGAQSSLEQEVERATDSNVVAFQRFEQQVEVLQQEIGGPLANAIADLIEPLTNVGETGVSAFAALGEAVAGIIIALDQTFTVIGKVLSGLKTVAAFGFGARFGTPEQAVETSPVITNALGGVGSRLTAQPAIPTFTSTRTTDDSSAPTKPTGGGSTNAELRERERLENELRKAEEKRAKLLSEFNEDQINLQERQLTHKEVLLGLTEDEEKLLKRLRNTAGDAFDVRRARNLEEVLEALTGQTKSFERAMSDVADEIENTEAKLRDLQEGSKERTESLRGDLEQFQADNLAEDADILQQRAADLAQALFEARQTTGGRIGGITIDQDPNSSRDRIEAFRTIEEIEAIIQKGDAFAQQILDQAQDLADVEQAGNAFERLEAEQKIADEKLKLQRESAEKQLELSIELEEAFQEGRLEAFLTENDEVLSVTQKRHALELQSKDRELRAELELQRQTQLQITQIFTEGVAIREAASEAFRTNEVARLNDIKNRALEAANAIRAARAASQGIGFATGGYVAGPGTATSDSIPAMLSNGEFVMNARAVDRYGLGLMSKLNTLSIPVPKFAQGGPVTTNNSKNANITVHNHGEAALVNTDIRRQKWRARSLL